MGSRQDKGGFGQDTRGKVGCAGKEGRIQGKQSGYRGCRQDISGAVRIQSGSQDTEIGGRILNEQSGYRGSRLDIG